MAADGPVGTGTVLGDAGGPDHQSVATFEVQDGGYLRGPPDSSNTTWADKVSRSRICTSVSRYRAEAGSVGSNTMAGQIFESTGYGLGSTR